MTHDDNQPARVGGRVITLPLGTTACPVPYSLYPSSLCYACWLGHPAWAGDLRGEDPVLRALHVHALRNATCALIAVLGWNNSTGRQATSKPGFGMRRL